MLTVLYALHYGEYHDNYCGSDLVATLQSRLGLTKFDCEQRDKRSDVYETRVHQIAARHTRYRLRPIYLTRQYRVHPIL